MGLGLGQKVRRVRQNLGLSQQQLAGTEMTRAFISLIEQGRCEPSTQSLAVIARRLGKPVEYFLDRTGTEDLEVIQLLLMAAERALKCSDLTGALRNANGALGLSQKLTNPKVEIRARQLLAQVCLKNRDFGCAYEHREEIVDLCKQTGDHSALAQAYFDLGNCAFEGEDFVAARRQFERCLRLTEGKKSLQELLVRALIGIGAACNRLGQSDAALNASNRAVTTARDCHYKALTAQALTGLGITCHRIGHPQEALDTLVQAMEYLSGEVNMNLLIARTYLGVILLDLGHLEDAWEHLRFCNQAYQERGLRGHQARVLDGMAKYWLVRGDLNQAEATAEKGLRVLANEENGIARGRLYRQLGRVYKARGNRRRAQELFRMSLEFFRRLKAADEMMTTITEMDAGTVDTAAGAETAGSTAAPGTVPS